MSRRPSTAPADAPVLLAVPATSAGKSAAAERHIGARLSYQPLENVGRSIVASSLARQLASSPARQLAGSPARRRLVCDISGKPPATNEWE